MANMKTKDINFYSQFADPSKKKNSIELILLVVAGVVIIALAGVYASLFLKDQDLKTQIDDLTAQTQDQTLLDKIKSSNEMAKDTQKLNLVLELYYQNDRLIEQQSVVREYVTDNLIMRIIECQSDIVKVNSFSYSDGTVTLSCTSATENEASMYVTRLRETEVFEWVDYNGFAGSNGSYSFTVTAIFNTDTGDEENAGA